MNPKAAAPVPDPNGGTEQIMIYIVAGVAVIAAIAVFLLLRYLWELRSASNAGTPGGRSLGG